MYWGEGVYVIGVCGSLAREENISHTHMQFVHPRSHLSGTVDVLNWADLIYMSSRGGALWRMEETAQKEGGRKWMS